MLKDQLADLLWRSRGRKGCSNDAELVSALPERKPDPRRTHFCSFARCSPGGARDMKISGTALTSLTKPHSSVSGTIRPTDTELAIVIRSSAAVWLERGDEGLVDIFFGCTSSKSIPPALTVSSKSLWLTGLGSARDGRLGVLDVLLPKLNEEDRVDGGRLGAETLG